MRWMERIVAAEWRVRELECMETKVTVEEELRECRVQESEV